MVRAYPPILLLPTVEMTARVPVNGLPRAHRDEGADGKKGEEVATEVTLRHRQTQTTKGVRIPTRKS